MGNCATINVTNSLPPAQDCTGSHHCDAGCPNALTNVCTSPDPCVQDSCAAGCPGAMICGTCGHIDNEISRANPESPCYVKPHTNTCQDFPVGGHLDMATGNWVGGTYTTHNCCNPGCSGQTSLTCVGGNCVPVNDHCAGDHCYTGCPDTYKCGVCPTSPKCPPTTTPDPCLTDRCSYGCVDSTKCGMCNNPDCPINDPINDPIDNPVTDPDVPTDPIALIQNNLPLLGLLFVGMLGVMMTRKN
jgi:hypothetical protein